MDEDKVGSAFVARHPSQIETASEHVQIGSMYTISRKVTRVNYVDHYCFFSKMCFIRMQICRVLKMCFLIVFGHIAILLLIISSLLDMYVHT
jgi:hypothetical protein